MSGPLVDLYSSVLLDGIVFFGFQMSCPTLSAATLRSRFESAARDLLLQIFSGKESVRYSVDVEDETAGINNGTEQGIALSGNSPLQSLLLNLLSNNSTTTPIRSFFSDREGETLIVGLGECGRWDEISKGAMDPCTANLLSLGATLIGACRFNSQNGVWILPMVEVKIFNKDGLPRCQLGLNIRGDVKTAADLLARVRWDFGNNRSRVPASLSSPVLPSRYLESAALALFKVRSGELQKIVIAIQRTASTTLDAIELLYSIPHSPGRFMFGMVDGDWGLFSVSPERLVRVDKEQVWSEALAGSFGNPVEPNSIDPQESEKLVLEHSTVLDFVVDRLRTILPDLRVSPRQNVSWGDTLTHYRQIVSGSVSSTPCSGPLLLQCLDLLNPTPAVCGLPMKPALETIAHIEGFDRRFYAGAWGRLDKDGGDLFVGIRGGEVDHQRVTFCAGAGLVDGSDPQKEWEEIGLKIDGVMGCLGLSDTSPTTDNSPNSIPPLALSSPSIFTFFLFFTSLRRQGISSIALSPGSRSSPLVLGASLAGLSISVFHDERVAGFYSLGASKAGRIIPIIVTSGTAVANLSPAVAEASASGLPLVVLTADREFWETSAGQKQCLRNQSRVFEGFDVWSKDVSIIGFDGMVSAGSGCALTGLLGDAAFSIGDLALRRDSIVHFNFQLKHGDLAPVNGSGLDLLRLPARLRQWMDDCHSQPWCSYGVSAALVAEMVRDCWKSGKSVLAVVGDTQLGTRWSSTRPLSSRENGGALATLSSVFHIPVLCDILSGLQPNGIDRALGSEILTSACLGQVGLLLWIGGGVIGKRMEEFVTRVVEGSHTQRVPVVQIWETRKVVKRSPRRVDPLQIVSHVASDGLEDVVGELLRNPQESGQRLDSLKNLFDTAILAISRLDSHLHALLTEPICARLISDHHVPVFLGAGMAVRDCDSFGGNGCGVAMNRGANGIDGIIATAIGWAENRGEAVSSTRLPIAYLGDVSTLHDCGSLVQLFSRRTVRVVTVNNDGGGIFAFLPISKIPGNFYSPAFDSPHGLRLAEVARGFCGGRCRVAAATDEPIGCFCCVTVRTPSELVEALNSEFVIFIECLVSSNHQENVANHRELLAGSVDAVERKLLQLKPFEESHSLIKTWKFHRALNSDLPLVVLLHGWTGHSTDWTQAAPSWPGGVVGVDLPGHGNTSPSVLFSPYVFADLLIRRFKDRRLLLVGYSMGGRFAIAAAERHPEAVVGVVLVSCGFDGALQSPVSLDPSLITYALFQDQLKPLIPVTVENALEILRLFPHPPPEVLLKRFFNWWYSGGVFSDLTGRNPEIVARRNLSNGSIDGWIRAQEGARVLRATSSTTDASPPIHPPLFPSRSLLGKILGSISGSLDLKYQALSHPVQDKCSIIDGGHALLLENPEGVKEAVQGLLNGCQKGLTSPSITHSTPPVLFIVGYSLEPFSFPLPSETPAHGNLVRSGWYLKFNALNEASRCLISGIGELIEPVRVHKGRRKRSLADWEAELKNCLDRLKGTRWEIEQDTAVKIIGFVLEDVNSLPPNPVVFAVEQAILTMLASQMDGFPLRELIREYLIGSIASLPPIPDHLKLNTLNRFYPSVTAKLKITGNWKQESTRINDLVYSHQLQPRSIRLDGNRTWSADDLKAFSYSLTPEAIAAVEYFEEPLLHSRLRRLRGLSGGQIRLALDEWLLGQNGKVFMVSKEHRLERSVEASPAFGSLVCVVKPFLFSLHWLRSLLAETQAVVISTSFESPIGLSFAACLAAAVLGNGVHGLHAAAWGEEEAGIHSSYIAACTAGSVDVVACERILRDACSKGL